MTQNVRSESLTIPYMQKTVDACVTVVDNDIPPKYGIILTHGAGGDMNLPQLQKLAQLLAECGFLVLRFTCKGPNLGYREYMKDKYKGLNGCFIGGRSMGSRAAVGVISSIKEQQLVNFIKGIICLSYPLHTKDNKSNTREAPLYELGLPVCFISGTHDEMCDKMLLTGVLARVTSAEMKWIDNADHSLKVKQCTEDEVVNDIGQYIVHWCHRVTSEMNAKTNVHAKQTKQADRLPPRGRKRKRKEVSL